MAIAVAFFFIESKAAIGAASASHAPHNIRIEILRYSAAVVPDRLRLMIMQNSNTIDVTNM
jgi:hypothetical protein